MSEHSHHIVSPKTYFKTFIALLVLTVITVAAAQIHIGAVGNIILALFIACIKASLVLCIFMGVWWEENFNRVIIFSTMGFVAIFLGLTAADVFTRGDVDPREKSYIQIDSNQIGNKSSHQSGSSSEHH